MQVDRDWTAEDYENLNPSGIRSLTNAMEFIKNPRKMCEEIASYVQQMVEIIQWHKCNKSSLFQANISKCLNIPKSLRSIIKFLRIVYFSRSVLVFE